MSKYKKENPILSAIVIVLVVVLLALLFIRRAQDKERTKVPQPPTSSSSAAPESLPESSVSSKAAVDPQNERWKDVTVSTDKSGIIETTFSSADDVASYTVVEGEDGKRNITIKIDGAKAADTGSDLSLNEISAEKLQNLVDVYAEKYTDDLIEREDMKVIAQKMASAAAMQYLLGKDEINASCDITNKTVNVLINRTSGDATVNIADK